MKILHVSHLYYPSCGGNEIVNQGLSEALAARGEQVTVFTTNAVVPGQLAQRDPDFAGLPPTEVINGVTVRRFTPRHRERKIFARAARVVSAAARCVRARRWDQSIEILRSRVPFVPQMLGAIRRYRPDIILAHNGYPTTTYFCYLARKYFHYPLIIRPTTHVAQTWHRHPFQLEMYRAADRLIASTEFERDLLMRQGIEGERIVRIGNGMDPAPFLKCDATGFRKQHDLGDSKVVAFVGRKTEGKGIEHLIDAMVSVWKTMPSARLILAGKQDGPHAAVIKDRIAAIPDQHAGNVIDIDDFDEEQKPAIYAACDVLVMASNIDSFGVVYLEAWASGKPVIACRNTPQETIIEHERDGLLVEYGNARELAQAIVRLLSNDSWRVQLGRAGKEKTLAHHTWDSVAKRVYAEYQRLVPPLD